MKKILCWSCKKIKWSRAKTEAFQCLRCVRKEKK